MKRIGIYGGAFDPIHNEHLHIIQIAKRELGLDKIVLVPSWQPPHKLPKASCISRIKMFNLIRDELPDVELDGIEFTNRLSYSADTLPLLKKKYGNIVHIIGGDSMIAMRRWSRPETVMQYPTAVISRGEPTQELLNAVSFARKEWKADITILSQYCTPISSSEIRLLFAVGKRELAQPLLPPRVYKYITDGGVYDVTGLAFARARLTPERFAHTQEVALLAGRIAQQVGYSENYAVLAGLWHDISKGHEVVDERIPVSCRQPNVLHAFCGALHVSDNFGFQQEEVLDAIRYHTTGRAEMGLLEKIIYVADYCEPTRTHPGAKEVYALLPDLNAAFHEAVRRSYQHVAMLPESEICPLTRECYQYYIVENHE